MNSGNKLKEQGIQLAIDNAELAQPGWKDKAIKFISKFPDSVFQAEQVRNYAHNNGLKLPPNPRAWGAVFTQAKRDGLIKFVGYSPVSNPKAHCTPAAVWERVKGLV